jgi:aminomethyltransferase
MKQTPLFETHRALGGKLIEFGGWEMPVQYTSIVDEHLAVRNAAGIFDISHMGEVSVSGPGALAFLNQVLTNDLRKLSPGQGQYTLMCNPQGGVIDDLYAYRLHDDKYLLIINASRIDDDVKWLENQLSVHPSRSEVLLKNISDATGAVAVQGPKVAEFINDCFSKPASGPRLSDLKKNQIAKTGFDEREAWVSRTGYTGEDGFEVVADSSVIVDIWTRILETGTSSGLKPAGLGARDTLRTEVCYPLYGHELDEQTTPMEAGLGFFVSFDKPDFVGRSALAEQKANGVRKKLIAFKMTERSAPPRPHYPILSAQSPSEKIGEVVSGTQSPSLNMGIGLGYVPVEYSKTQTPIEIEIRGKRAKAMVVQKPIFRKPD